VRQSRPIGTARGLAIATITQLPSAKAATGLSLLFAVGERPTAAAVARALDDGGGPAATRISHAPAGDAGWVELLANGLTFDLSGLAPTAPEAAPPARHVFGLPDAADRFSFEAVRLAPGPHIVAGRAMIPAVRIMMAVALELARLPGLRAVCWHPAGSWMDAGYFGRVMQAWLAGGAFPALGLAGMVREADGTIRSQGLRFFIGQELSVDARTGEAQADTIKLAVRVADLLVHAGRLEAPHEFSGPGGEPLLAEPSPDGRLAFLRRIV